MSNSTMESHELLEHAKKLLEQGKWQESQNVYQHLIECGSFKAEGFYGLGVIEFALGHYVSATRLFRTCLAHAPQASVAANAYYYLGQIVEKTNAADDAHAYYDRALELNPNHAKALKRHAALQARPSHQSASQAAANGVHEGKAAPTASTPPRDYGFYALLSSDTSPLAQHVRALIDTLEMSIQPRLSAYQAPIVGWLGTALVSLWALAALVDSSPVRKLLIIRLDLALRDVETFIRIMVFLGLLGLPVTLVILLYTTIKAKNTTIEFNQGRLKISTGVFGRKVENIELYRVTNVERDQDVWNRLIGEGSIILQVEGHKGRANHHVALTGLAKYDRLQEIFEPLRDLVLLLRTSQWGKGVIY
jgi:hypothetical protein